MPIPRHARCVSRWARRQISSQFGLVCGGFIVYGYVLFMCHLTVEKPLKTIVAESSTVFPPCTHNLYRLLELGHITLPPVYEDLVAKLNAMSVVTRYPEDITTLSAEVTRKVAQAYLTKTKELIQWLRQDARLQPSSADTSLP
jgi:HEPN domain-containing protein